MRRAGGLHERVDRETGGGGNDKKVNSYPMTSEDDQSGRLTAAADVAEPKRPWRGCRFHPDRAWNSGSRIMRGTFRDMATLERVERKMASPKPDEQINTGITSGSQ